MTVPQYLLEVQFSSILTQFLPVTCKTNKQNIWRCGADNLIAESEKNYKKKKLRKCINGFFQTAHGNYSLLRQTDDQTFRHKHMVMYWNVLNFDNTHMHVWTSLLLPLNTHNWKAYSCHLIFIIDYIIFFQLEFVRLVFCLASFNC